MLHIYRHVKGTRTFSVACCDWRVARPLVTDPETGKLEPQCICDVARHQNSVNAVRWSPDGKFLASADTGICLHLFFLITYYKIEYYCMITSNIFFKIYRQCHTYFGVLRNWCSSQYLWQWRRNHCHWKLDTVWYLTWSLAR